MIQPRKQHAWRYGAAALLLSACSQNSETEAAQADAAPQSSQQSEADQTAMTSLSDDQRDSLKALTANMERVRNDVLSSSANSFSDEQVVAQYKSQLKGYFETLQTFPLMLDESTQDTDILAARKGYQDLRAALSEQYQRAQSQAAPVSLGQSADSQIALGNIERAFQANPVPQTPYEPYDKAKMVEWMASIASSKQVMDQATRELNEIAQKQDLPNNVPPGSGYDIKALRRMQNFAGNQSRKVDQEYEKLARIMSDALVGLERDVPNYRGNYAQENLAKAEGMAETAYFLNTQLGKDASRAKALLDLIKTKQSNLATDAAVSLESARLPKSASKDKKRIKIAKEILATPKYGFGEHGPIVLTTKKIETKETKDKEFDVEDVDVSIHGDVTLSGTETTWTHKWDEFKFVTPIKDTDGKWYMWTITAKKFESGYSTTPIGRWVSGKAVKGSQILEDNF